MESLRASASNGRYHDSWQNHLNINNLDELIVIVKGSGTVGWMISPIIN